MTMVNREELAQFLRRRRSRLHPDEVGLPENGPRRTPGLRRQEVAQLAGMSVDYYIRLEQARGPCPSRQILSALARALILTIDEREYMFRIAGESPPPARSPSREVPSAVLRLLDTLTESPAYVLDAKYDILAWNMMAIHVTGDLAAIPEAQRNLIRWMFQPGQENHSRWRDPDTVSFARASVADLRAAYAQYSDDPGLEGLVEELREKSPRFAKIWADHEVEVRRRTVKRIRHPREGELSVECQVLHIPETDQRLIVYCAEPGSPTQEAFRRLAHVGDVTAPPAHTVGYRCGEEDTSWQAPETATAAQQAP